MKTLILILSLFFSFFASAQLITDFNFPLWNYGTANGADASGSGVISGIPFSMTFHKNNGTKLFTTTLKHTSNSTLGHGGPLGSLVLGGVDEGLTITFASPVNVILGLSHINNTTDGWNFITPADEVVTLHNAHEIIGGASINGIRQNTLGPAGTATDNTSYIKWNNVTAIDIQTVGAPSTTLALSSMNAVSTARNVPSLSTWGIIFLISILGFFGLRGGNLKTKPVKL